MAVRNFIDIRGIRLSYIDFGGDGKPLLALHGHYGCARMFAGLARALGDEWRVIALDQRGHGWSDHHEDYSRDAYIGDLAALIGQLGIAPAVVLGHSLGGLNAYQLAARHPVLVKALIVEDIGAVIPRFPEYTEGWPRRFGSLKEYMQWAETRGSKDDTYFLESLVEHPDGWGFRFDYRMMDRSMSLIAGDWWQDWLASSCPALLLHGHKSWVMEAGHAREMAARRPHTRLVEFPDCGHTIHDDWPDAFTSAVKAFLASL